MNLFGFVGNGPTSLIDRDGLTGWGINGPGWKIENKDGQWEFWPPPGPPPTTPLEAARRKIGCPDYSSLPTQFLFSPPNWWFDPQCNRFVGDCIATCKNRPKPLVNGRYPTAAEWGDPTVSIPGFGPPHHDPKPGDVVTTGWHVGIMDDDGYIESPTLDGWVKKIPINNDRDFHPDKGRTPIP